MILVILITFTSQFLSRLFPVEQVGSPEPEIAVVVDGQIWYACFWY